MSGYKNSGFGAQETYQGALAFAAFSGLEFNSERLYDAWDAFGGDAQQLWVRVAEAVRDDTRTEPQW